jgi:peptidoglycan DL-endopeptidase CwlO
VASRGHLRSVLGALSATVMALAAAAVLTSPAHADPPPAPVPPKPADAAAQLKTAEHDAEALTEQWHSAKDQLDAKNDEAQRAQAAVEPARQAASRAEAAEEKFRTDVVDQVTSDAMESGRLDELNALVLSDSPSDFLDQMTTLETYTSDQKALLEKAQALVATARTAKAEADSAVARAQQAASQARAALNEIDVRKKQAEARITQAQKLLGQLTPAQKAARTASQGSPLGVVLGTSKGALALKAAMTRIGIPYVWAATGPKGFDCSGLVYWAFKKVGITMPRSSASQASVGTPVAKSDLQPGDLVFFYHPVSHVGFYAGNGKVLNAVQTGDTVRYTDLSRMKSYAGARRL